MDCFELDNAKVVFGQNEYLYQRVLDDFKNTSFIGIITFNISTKPDSILLSLLKDACDNGSSAVIITNIPKRFSKYYKTTYALAAKKTIDMYKKCLNPQNYSMRLNPYFAFDNHAKVVLTDNMVYWGSSNFSDESSQNIECGTLSTDKELIKYMRETLFTNIQDKSIPYYKNNFAVAISNLESLIPVCKEARDNLFESSFEPWADYDTDFEEKWIFRKSENCLTISFLRNFISFIMGFDEALNVIDKIVDEYWDFEELPEEVEQLSGLYDEYKKVYEDFFTDISSLFDALEPMAAYDVSSEACRRISNEYGMEAYDEYLDDYTDKVMDETLSEYEELIENSEQTLRDSIERLDSIIKYFEQLKINLYKLLKVNAKIDNTNI